MVMEWECALKKQEIADKPIIRDCRWKLKRFNEYQSGSLWLFKNEIHALNGWITEVKEKAWDDYEEEP